MTLSHYTQQIFRQHWGYQPRLTVQAPGRVNIIGEHTDYNEGFVLPCAINYSTVISAAPREDRLVRVIAADYDDQQDCFSLDETITPHPQWQWCNYIRGVVKFLLQRVPLPAGADLVISGNVPQGAGLSSSASLEVAVGQAFQALYALPLNGVELALNGQQAENQFVGCQCGIMDQLISALGQRDHALLIDCRSLTTQAVPLPPNVAVMIINSHVQRGLVDSEYNTRRAQCEAAAAFFQVKALRDVSWAEFTARCHEMDPLVARRARHIITENSRTQEAASALACGDLRKMSQLMYESHLSMRDDFAITHPAIDALVEIVKNEIGDQGGVRMTGGGFGGCVVALVPHTLVDRVAAAVAEYYPRQAHGLKATCYVCQAMPGAGVC